MTRLGWPGNRRVVVAVAALAVALPSLVIVPATAQAAVEPGRRVAVFTDSVGLGAEQAIPAAFGDGWSVHVDGQPARFVEQIESQYVRPRLASNPDWFGDHVVIAAGYNAPYWDWERFDRSVDSLIDTLTEAGVKHVHWVTLREVKREFVSEGAWNQVQPYMFYFPTVNEHLRAALDRHANLTLVDWAAVADQPGLTYDAIHLNTTGAALYSAIIRESVLNAATRVPDQSSTTLTVPGGAGAGAAFVNLTTVGPRTSGYLAPAAAGCDRAQVSVHNFVRSQTVAHSAIVPLAADGSFCVRSRAATNLVADTGGVFRDGFVAVTPQRWADTRTSGARPSAGAEVALGLAGLELPDGVEPGTVAALALSVTAVDAAGPGWFRVLPCGTTASTSNVNYLGGEPTPNLVLVAPDERGEVCVRTSASSHVVVDVFGVFTEAAGFAAVSDRAYDSRTAGPPLTAGSVTRLAVGTLAPDVHGAVLNLTAVGAEAPGYLTAYPCAAGRPPTSNLNVATASPVSNAVIVAPDANGEVCVFNLSTTHVIVDVQAVVGPAFDGRPPQRLLDTRNQPDG